MDASFSGSKLGGKVIKECLTGASDNASSVLCCRRCSKVHVRCCQLYGHDGAQCVFADLPNSALPFLPASSCTYFLTPCFEACQHGYSTWVRLATGSFCIPCKDKQRIMSASACLDWQLHKRDWPAFSASCTSCLAQRSGVNDFGHFWPRTFA